MTLAARLVRERLAVRGAVQGVGFRPFVYRLARGLGLAGWVENTTAGVSIEIEGPADAVDNFRERLGHDAPRRASVQSIEVTPVAPGGEAAFAIRPSAREGRLLAPILPDIVTCDACLREMADPSDRRFRYPFINCTDCGPRYSIVLGLPYDRGQTTMQNFALCDGCRSEYEDPGSRRFHAEPIACPTCGPHIELWAPDGRVLARREQALAVAVAVVRSGRTLAVKGLGGFQLVVDARDEEATRRLRRRKGREEKPLAVMVYSLDEVTRYAHIDEREATLLSAPQGPIVLVRRRAATDLAESVAPGNPNLGMMLPTTPLHHLLLGALDCPIVATSGNRTDEPIAIDEREALVRLAGVADAFLVHDRPIARYVDDSVVRVVDDHPMVLRRARGYAPLPVATTGASASVLAVGAHLKNTVALSVGESVVLSPHIGDLDTELALDAFDRTVAGLSGAYRLDPVAVACDTHPDYASTQRARRSGKRVIAVQHHHAHVLAGMADRELAAPVLGVAWDGSGLGSDGTIWGGEFLRVDETSFRRVAHLRTFRLPGGDAAVREPRRSAAGATYEIDGWLDPTELPGRLFSEVERSVIVRMLQRPVNAPLTSSAGRLFDAVAAMVGLPALTSFEGQAAMALEHAIGGRQEDDSYPFAMRAEGDGWVVDWEPLLRQVRKDAKAGRDRGTIALLFHNALAEMIVSVACRVGEPVVLLTGGCFQNRYLTERALARLRANGFSAYAHRRIPPNDGGIAVGQVVAALREMERA